MSFAVYVIPYAVWIDTEGTPGYGLNERVVKHEVS